MLFRGVPVVVMDAAAAPQPQHEQQVPTAPPLRPNAMTKTAIARLPTRSWTADQEPAKCGVCLSDYATGDVLLTLPCLHAFHRDCVTRWLLTNARCPICREPSIPTS